MLPPLTGYRSNPTDARDVLFDFAKARDRFKLRTERGDGPAIIDWVRTPRSQVGGSCVANAWCHALEMLADAFQVPVPVLSAQGLYWCARQRHGDQDHDDGTWPRSAGDALVKVGVGDASLWPDSYATLNTQPGPDYFVEAYDKRIKIDAYYNVLSSGEERLNELEHAILAGHPIVFGVPVSQEFLDYRGENYVIDAPNVRDVIGWHALVVHGVVGRDDQRSWKVLNSWGPNWGFHGGCWVTSEYMQRAIDMHVPVLTVAEVSS